MSPRAYLVLLLLASLLGSRTEIASAQQGGLVAAYAFSEASGATAQDASGNGNTGVLSGATWTTAGKYGSALAFDGGSALVRIDDAPSLRLTGQMTLEAWVYPTASGGWRDVVYKATDAYYLAGSSLFAGVPATGGSMAPGDPLYAPAVLPLGTWSHLASTYDGATLRLYINGAEVASRVQTGSIASSTAPLTIGGDGVFGQFWAGLIDEVRVYNRALSAAEIQSDLGRPIPASTDTVPPSVSIVSPGDGSPVSHVTAISATASDDVGISSVELFLDGASRGVDASAPYVFTLDTTAVSNGMHTLQAVARDLGGNQTTSSSVSVTFLNPAFVNEVVVPDITGSTTIAFLPDGRMLIGELGETIWVRQPGAAQP